MQNKAPISVEEVLIRGSDILKSKTNFKVVGREQELMDISGVLMKMRKRNIIITGRGGVGVSSLVLGIQDSKKNLTTPVEIVNKRFYWLETDKLFESGNHQIINEIFQRIRQILTKTNNSVLILEDTVDFIRSAQHTGCMNLINGLMGDLKTGKYQAILESKDDCVGEILKCDGDILEFSSLYEVKEPNIENLKQIVTEAINELENHHHIQISTEAIHTAITLTERYKLPELRAQPDASITLLDHSLTDRNRRAHTTPPHIESLTTEIKNSESKDQKLQLELKLEEARHSWQNLQEEIRRLYRDISDGETEIRKLEEEIELIRVTQFNNAKTIESSSSTESKQLGAFSSLMTHGNLDIPEISDIRKKILRIEEAVQATTTSYKEKLRDVYKDLTLTQTDVLKTFSTLSGIPVDKLGEDEKVKLRGLEQVLASRVIGQEEPTCEVAKAVKRSRLGLKMPNKPSGTFMFLGPSGVGKTELAKALSHSLDVPLLRFDMSEYMEKHAVAKLIGAPPGYEGFENGGILTNAVRRNPYSVVLFDEIEKAHTDVFNLMLQLLDDARLTDSRGLTASFKDTIIIMTTNIGTIHFLDEGLSFEESKDLALSDLREVYRPEFLGRFGGNIYCFKRLSDDVLLSIAKKDISRINLLIKDQSIEIEMQDQELSKLIKSKYLPREGARSILGYIDRNITSGIADLVLGETSFSGKIRILFDLDQDQAILVANNTIPSCEQ